MPADPAGGSPGLEVGFLCAGWSPDPGGVESHTQDLARELLSRGHRVSALCLDYDPSLEDYSTRDSLHEGVHVRRLAYRYQNHGALADVVVHPEGEAAIRSWVAERRFDLVHVHHLTGFGMGALSALSEAGVPSVMTLHDYWPLCPRGQMLRWDGAICATAEPEACATCIARTWAHLMPSGTGRSEGPAGEVLEGEPEERDRRAAELRTAFALAALELPARLFTPSEASRGVYLRAGLAPERIEVCENGIEVAGLRAAVAAAREPRQTGSVHLGVLGSVLPSKGVLELARAFVRADAPELWLEVHGNLPSYHGDSTYVEALQELAQEHPRLRLHGTYEHQELAGILATLDGVAAPSRWVEVFGLTVREARAAGLPVIVSDAGGLAPVAAGGRAGLVVASEDAGAWVAALQRFASDDAARERWAAHPAEPRSAHAMLLQLERAYVDVVRAATGSEPALVHPLEGAPRSGSSGSTLAGGVVSLWRRLFGGRD